MGFGRSDSLTEREIMQIAKLQRDAGVQRLSSHFSWTEFSDHRRCFHQDFVYDVTMFAATRGFPWPDVIRAAVLAKGFFQQLGGHDVCELLSSLRAVLSEILSNLTPVLRQEFTRFLTDTCTAQRRLFQAVLGGAANISITQLHLELQLPPTPCPLAQGTDLQEWEHQCQQARLTSALQQKEEELRRLRAGPRVTLGEDEELDSQEAVLDLVPAAVKATNGQILASLNQEVSLLGDILQLKLQQAALATGRLHNPERTRMDLINVCAEKGKSAKAKN